jgi:type VI secretion system protein ImpE
MDAKQLFEAGKLAESITAVTDSVKKNPTDAHSRSFLAELLCFTGNLERADKQLDALGEQQPEVMPNLVLLRHLIRAEMARREFFEQGRLPEFFEKPTAAQQLRLQASIHLREGRPDEAFALIEEAEEACPTVSGTCDGQAFEGIRDLDDLVGGSFEVLTSNGDYYWVPMERVISLEFYPPETVLDLLWVKTHMLVKDGPEGDVYIPTVYNGSHDEDDEMLKLGRATDWRGEEGQSVRGIGQRTYLLGEEDRPILTLKELTFGDGTS